MAERKMTDLKRKPSEGDDDRVVSEGEKDKAFFPLNLFISSPEVEKLGLLNAKVGEEHDLLARVKITSVSVSEDEGSEKRESVTLTLLAGEVQSERGEEDRAKKLFDGK